MTTLRLPWSEGQLTQGEYKVKLPDRRKQVVSYEADELGFRPRISYEPTAPDRRIQVVSYEADELECRPRISYEPTAPDFVETVYHESYPEPVFHHEPTGKGHILYT